MTKYPRLFSPLRIKHCVFPNRIMSMAAVTRLAAEDGHVTEDLKERYRRMALGGLGGMVIEAAAVLPSKSSFNLRISDDQFVPELADLVSSLRQVNPDLKVGLQLLHFLKVARSGWRQKVEDLKPEEIEIIPEQFSQGAGRAKAAGFDFVEIHMAHFTTLASFLSLVNKRQDQYGGDFEGRVKLPVAVVTAVRRAVGGDFPVGVRINGEEFTKEGNTLLQSSRIARRLAQSGVDYINVSAGERFEDATAPPPNSPPFAGTGYSGYRMSPRWWNPDGVQVFLAEGVRRAVREAGYDIPIITAGKIRTPDLAEEIIEQGRADIIGLARAVLCDPDWPIKAREGKAGEIVKCAACGYCSEADERYERITCIQWPRGALNAPVPWRLVPPCQAACPAGLDVRGYVDLIAQGHYERALSVIREKVPFPATISRVCPRPCEVKCNRQHLDESIAINALKRFAADRALPEAGEVTPAPRSRDERIAIIGAGPAGLTAAFQLVKLGYGAAVFEALPFAGGMLRVGIPDYRLPKHLVETEIAAIQKSGVDIRLNSPVGEKGLTVDDLRRQGYRAILIAAGAHKGRRLNIPGEDASEVFQGITFLKAVNLGQTISIGNRVVVVGGGNVAIDAARSALRLGSKEVTIVYRRSLEEMPAHPEAVQAAQAEGVRIYCQAAPVRIATSGGRVAGVECLRTEPGEADESGRRRPVPVSGSEFMIAADTVIPAIGEIPDIAFLDGADVAATENGTINVNQHTLATAVKGIFAAGDVVSGPATVIEAIAAGSRAALSIDRYLRGDAAGNEEPLPNIISIDTSDTAGFKKRGRQPMPCLPTEKRAPGFPEVEIGFSEPAALGEADRCLQCGMFPRK